MAHISVGDVRPSQIVTTFGPGAIVDLPTTSVIVSGIDTWAPDADLVIREPRLARALGVHHFYPAKPATGSLFQRRGTIPAYIFPRYQFCPACRTLSRFGENYVQYDVKHKEMTCTAPECQGRSNRRVLALPAPFVVACPSGHIDDFPWREYAHRGAGSCRGRMALRSVARTGSVADLMVKCQCDASRSMSDAFAEARSTILGECTRHRPWLGIGNRDSAVCRHSTAVRPLQRGATNSWFPVVRSALGIGDAATPVGMALRDCDATQIAQIDTRDKLQVLVGMRMFPSLEPFAYDDIWLTIQKERGAVQTNETDLRWPEWLAFRDVQAHSDDRDELFLNYGAVPNGHEATIGSVVLARKLLEVRALLGFTRIDASGGSTGDRPDAGIAPIYRRSRNWLPAIEVRGEGIFIELQERAVAAWEAKPAVRKRTRAMAATFRQWANDRGRPESVFPGARYLLLHSLAHSLIRQLSLDCGYPASAVRERIYSSSSTDRPMAGILVYAASADSAGSLGGLVDLGNRRRFPGLLRNALRAATRCSSDPLCASHRPDVHATINAAACHACILASETSCEVFNRFLDRNTLVGTMATTSIAFFSTDQA